MRTKIVLGSLLTLSPVAPTVAAAVRTVFVPAAESSVSSSTEVSKGAGAVCSQNTDDCTAAAIQTFHTVRRISTKYKGEENDER